MARRSISSLISDLENSPLHWGCYAATFIGLVIARNLIEGALGPDRILGFTYFASPSALMVLDHFLFFYVSLFLGFSILLSVLIRERIGRVMKVMTPAWALILIPPVLDFILTAGSGVRITYVLDLSPVILRFFDPMVALDRVSYGQRVEILLACILACGYVRIRTRSWTRAVGSFIGVYILIAIHGVLPSLYAKSAWFVTEGAGTGAAAAYDAAFKSGGIVQEESRKLALLFLFASILLGWIALRMHTPKKTDAVCANVRPLRSMHYTGMTVFGVALGWAVFAPAGIEFSGGGDLLGVLGVCVATFFALQASIGLNDLFDEQADRIAGAHRPLVTGILERKDAILQAVSFSAIALLLALNVKYSTFLLMALVLAVSVFYSAPPLRLKRIPILATVTLGLLSLLAALIGFSAFAEERSVALFPPRLGWLLVLSFGLAFTAKDLKDIDGDRATGTLTLPILLGPRAGKAAVAVLLALGYLLIPLLLPYRVLIVPSILLGLASAALVYLWKRPGVDNVLLAVYLAFALVVATVVGRDVDALLAGENPLLGAKVAQIQGRNAEARSRWDQAADRYLHAARMLTDDPALLEHTGVSLFNSNRMEKAAAMLEMATESNPSSPVAREYLAISEMKLGHTDVAAMLMTTAVRSGMRPGIFLSHLGDLYLTAGDPASARSTLAHALHVGHGDVPTRIRYADALAALGLVDESRHQYERVVERDPSSAEALDALGRFYHSAGRPDMALPRLQRAVSLAPAEATFWNNLSVVYRDLKRYGETLDALDRATRLDPALVDAYYNRGRVYDTLGRHDEARRQYLLALEIDPSFAQARKELEKHGLGDTMQGSGRR
ncbi:MAG: UbiA family prenyltransferase [Candidatus Eisenbacteria sp.]|nr:UbiA family prenyltransferase [Candidatus Eisenbacteria bacterium]